MSKKPYTIMMDTELMSKVDVFAKVKGDSRSGFINRACAEYIGALEKIPDAKAAIEEFQAQLEKLKNLEL